MGYEKTFIASDEARSGAPLVRADGVGQDIGADRACVSAAAGAGRFIALIESRTFVRECIRRSLQSAFALPVVTYSTVAELEHRLGDASPELAMLSLMDASAGGCANALKALSDLVPSNSIVVLGLTDDEELAGIAVRNGARGYIPCTMGFEIAVEALRVVLAGGAYAPIDSLLARGGPKPETPRVSSPTSLITRREQTVVRAIQQGKSNKVIAHEMNLCESTVKVHVRNIMKKLRAKNRTEVAIKAQAAWSPQLA
ncbi:MAG: response regulator transcription factor [Hyphomicrobiales bacterium]|nr:response regulator transcription factor [Hyphomicrobiales bacterium]